MNDVMTVVELAALLRISRASAYRACTRGEIPGVVRVGKSLRVCRATVLAWLAQGSVMPRKEG